MNKLELCFLTQHMTHQAHLEMPPVLCEKASSLLFSPLRLHFSQAVENASSQQGSLLFCLQGHIRNEEAKEQASALSCLNSAYLFFSENAASCTVFYAFSRYQASLLFCNLQLLPLTLSSTSLDVDPLSSMTFSGHNRVFFWPLQLDLRPHCCRQFNRLMTQSNSVSLFSDNSDIWEVCIQAHLLAFQRAECYLKYHLHLVLCLSVDTS